MARIEIVAEIPHFRLLRTDSYLDAQESPWLCYQVRPLFVFPPAPSKKAYCLSWHVEERRLADSSELRDLGAHFPNLPAWAETQISRHNMED